MRTKGRGVYDTPYQAQLFYQKERGLPQLQLQEKPLEEPNKKYNREKIEQPKESFRKQKTPTQNRETTQRKRQVTNGYILQYLTKVNNNQCVVCRLEWWLGQ